MIEDDNNIDNKLNDNKLNDSKLNDSKLNDNKLNDNKLDDSKNNGLITKIWGEHAWEFFHSVTFGFPVSPSDEQRQKYKMFFMTAGDVLPCKYCRESYGEFIRTDPDAKLTDIDLENRDTLTKWLFRLHDRVNKKLGITYNLSYENVCDKYESYRAKCIPAEKGCNMPISLKANAFQKNMIHHAPVINKERYEGFKEYAKSRGVIFDDVILGLLRLDRNNNAWILRDRKCRHIINKMRLSGLPNIEKDGKYLNLPTIDELKLIKLLCSDICCEELDIMIKNIKENMHFT